ncbi:MAG: methylcrotonoyl-CoA carboxylase, partial [Deltaproteobacteria bacterium]|nr:methylcrotonoyl-CoA carboxylase [Deltaproteobacteria bacterium]
MEIIETKVDTSSEEYRENYQAMDAMVTDLRKELEIAQEDRSEKARARLAQQNKLSVRARLELLFDRNTPFMEIAPLAAKGMY